MNGTVRYVVSAQPCAGLLCRIVGLFAQTGSPPPAMSVAMQGDTMKLDLSTDRIDAALAPVMARRMAGFVGVLDVRYLAAGADLALPGLTDRAA